MPRPIKNVSVAIDICGKRGKEQTTDAQNHPAPGARRGSRKIFHLGSVIAGCMNGDRRSNSHDTGNNTRGYAKYFGGKIYQLYERTAIFDESFTSIGRMNARKTILENLVTRLSGKFCETIWAEDNRDGARVICGIMRHTSGSVSKTSHLTY